MPGATQGSTVQGEWAAALVDCGKRATALLGGGCVIRAFDPEAGGYVARAVDHVDESRRGHLRISAKSSLVSASGGWVAQALERRRTVRLSDVGTAVLSDLGLPQDERIGEVMVVPVPALRAALIATRDRVAGPFGPIHRRHVERLASELEGSNPASPAERTRGVFSLAACERLLDVTSAAMCLVDDRGATVYLNQAASELVGCPADEVCGVPIHEFLGHAPTRSRAGFYGDEATDRPLVRGDGTVRWVSVTSRPLSDAAEYQGTVYTLIDIDERREREVDLRMRAQCQGALLDLADHAADGDEGKDLAEQAVSTVAEQLEVELASIGTVDHDRGTATPVAAIGWPRDALRGNGERGAFALPQSSAPLHAARTGEPVIVLDYESTSPFERGAPLERVGVRSAGLVPFAHGTAMLAAHSTRPEAIGAEGIALMESVARLVEPCWPPRSDPE